MKRYYKGLIHQDTLKHGSDKAFYCEYDSGRMAANKNGHIWFPRSICIVEEPNDLGWCKILIPQWFFFRNRVDYHRVREINFGFAGEGLFEER